MMEEARETAMELLASMMLRDRAERESRSFNEVFAEFRRSRTFEQLFDAECGLWMNGPDYISDEYDLEKKRLAAGRQEKQYETDQSV